MATVASDLSKLKTRSGLEAYVNQNRALMIGVSDSYHEAAEYLKLISTRYLRSRMSGIEASYKIKRMVRPLDHAADLAEDAAKSFGVTLKLYNGLFIPQQNVAPDEMDPYA
jgi:hypothetical protein